MEPTLKPSRPVMDIRPQRPAPQPLPRANFAAATPAGPSMVQPTPAAASAPTPEEHHEVQPTPEYFPAKLPRSKAPIGVIVTAILVGACLIGVAVFGYLKTHEDSKVTKQESTSEKTQAVTADEVDSSVSDADDALNSLDEAADFSDSALSDEILGL